MDPGKVAMLIMVLLALIALAAALGLTSLERFG